MNRYEVENNIGKARASIQEVYGTNKVEKTMRSKMSAFGAAVLMGGPLSALTYYQKNEANVVTLLAKMYGKKNGLELVQMFEKESPDIEELLAKSVSLKLALNLFI